MKTPQILQVFQKDLSLFRGRPMLWLAVVTIAFLPTLYTVIYLGAVWDPYTRLDHLPVGLVMLDEGTNYQGKDYDLGRSLKEELEEKKPFHFIPFKNDTEAESAVRSGEVYFALIIPPDFSRKALSGEASGSLKLFTSQGTSFISNLMAKRFVAEIARRMNERIGIERWRRVLVSAQDARRGIRKLFVASISIADKKAESLAVPVQWDQKELAPIETNGQGFAPYFMSLSLWLGVVVSAFLFRLRVFPRSLEGTNKTAKIFGKGLLPLLITLSSAGILGVTLQHVLKVSILDSLGFYAVLLVSTFAYSAIVLSLVRLVGDAGKLISVIFLVVQIASSGGAYPIQLSPRIYQVIAPFLPLTFTVEGLRAAMFGSYDGNWVRSLLALLPWMLISLVFSFLSTRQFQYVAEEDYGPALDLSRR